MVPDEDDIILRYLLVLKGPSSYSNTLISTKVEFDKHYNTFVKEMTRIAEAERQSRIESAYSEFKERKRVQVEEVKKIREKAVESVRKADEELIEK